MPFLCAFYVGATASNEATTSVQDEKPVGTQTPTPTVVQCSPQNRASQGQTSECPAAVAESRKETPKEGMEGANRHMWSLWSRNDRLLLQDEVLYRRWFDEKTGRESLKLCVPQNLKGHLLQEL